MTPKRVIFRYYVKIPLSLFSPGKYYKKSNCGYLSGFSTGCPYICDICSHSCGNKTCQNGGTMNYKTCECACQEEYTGAECEIVKCPGMNCQNGGQLNLTTCECTCSGLYHGDQCELVDCPDGDTNWLCTYGGGL